MIVGIVIDSSYSLDVTIPSTLRHGSLSNAIFLVFYIVSFLGFTISYLILTFRQAKGLWAMYTE